MRTVIAICILTMLLSTKTQCQRTGDVDAKLLTLIEGQVDLAGPPASEASSCLVVNNDGTFYIEKREHLLRDPVAAHIFEGHLTGAQLNNLRSILSDEHLQSVSEYGINRMPQNTDAFSWVTARITRGSSVQEVDYRHWRKFSAEYNGTSSWYTDQQASRLQLLRPLVDWSHSIQVGKLTSADGVPRHCSD